MFEIQAIELCPVCKVIADRFLYIASGINSAGRFLDMDHQCDGVMPMKFLYPADNEFLGIMVEVLFMKRRRINGIEELS